MDCDFAIDALDEPGTFVHANHMVEERGTTSLVLSGYVSEKDVTTVRDAVCRLSAAGTVMRHISDGARSARTSQARLN